jgi:hypothetical protein
MARVGNSIFDIQGKLGDLVYYRYKGKSMVRKAVTRKRNNPTQVQLEHQAKFMLIAKFLRPLTDFLKVTYKIYNRNNSGYQKAFSENYHKAITGAYPSYSIDYSKVRLGNGKLPEPSDVTINSPDPGKLVFSWSDIDKSVRSLSSDQFYVAIYCEQLNHWICQFRCADRYQHFCRVDASFFSRTRVQIYIGFVSADGKLTSNPLYCGEQMIS